jgi:hypothetical protein
MAISSPGFIRFRDDARSKGGRLKEGVISRRIQVHNFFSHF